MSFLYRPTPVVNLGNGPFASTRVISGWTSAAMRGIPAGTSALGAGAPTGAVSRMRRVDTRYQPWIKTSGTMGSFLPNGLGQDAGSSIDWSTAGDIAPTIPDYVPVPDLTPPDLGSPSFQPNLPALIGPSSGPAAPYPIDTTMYTAPAVLVPPRSGAGAGGAGIPGTQPLNPAALIAPATSLVNTIKSWFTPSPAAPAGYRALPGYGGGVASPAAIGILPGVPNTTLLFGAAAIVLVLAMAGGGRK